MKCFLHFDFDGFKEFWGDLWIRIGIKPKDCRTEDPGRLFLVAKAEMCEPKERLEWWLAFDDAW